MLFKPDILTCYQQLRALHGLASSIMTELVSCVMATKDRPQFFRIALDCFLRQTYGHSELIVIDDGESVEEICTGIDRVQYIRLPQATPLGTKLNVGIAAAKGPVLQKLDDDDYYHPDFLKTSVGHLPSDQRDRCLVAWDCFLILQAGERIPRYSGHGWKAGGTFCFSRNLWERQPFRDLPKSVDSWLLRDHQPRVIPVCEPEMYVMVRHGRNTWTKMQGGIEADDFLRSRPVYTKALDAIVHPEASRFYYSIV